MKTGSIVAGGIVVGGAFYLLARSGALAQLQTDLHLAPPIDPLTGQPYPPTPTAAEQVRALALRQPGAANTPIAGGAPSFISTGGLGAIAGLAAAALPLLGVGGVALGISTAGIGLAVAFLSYELLRQRESIAVNRARDAWQHQFIDLSNALGIPPVTYASTAGGGGYSPGVGGGSNGSVEMSRVIFFFDHDPNNTLWKAANTQDMTKFRNAANAIDAFLRAQGVPVQNPG
jgi:hypothetical protein